MASPPYHSPATSPPHIHSTLPQSRKRPSIGPPGLPPHKRRKQSSFSHPLRQTSFPPEEAEAHASNLKRNARSPSVDSDYSAVTGITANKSIANGPTASRKGKRGKYKSKTLDTASVLSGQRGGTTEGGRSGRGGTATRGNEEEEEDDEDDADEDDDLHAVDEGGTVDRAAEQKKMAVLMEAFNTDQSERYNAYRRVKLKKETVRRITNATLSQSVPQSVITTLNGFTKVFIGTIIEKAREVQRQRFAADPSLHLPKTSRVPPDTPLVPGTPGAGPGIRPGAMNGTYANGQIVSSPPSTEQKMKKVTDSSEAETTGAMATRSRKLGPLEPDHIREALRRYKANGEGGGAGVEGRTLNMGIAGSFAARRGSKRLFH